MPFCAVGAELLHADWQTDRHDVATYTYKQHNSLLHNPHEKNFVDFCVLVLFVEPFPPSVGYNSMRGWEWGGGLGLCLCGSEQGQETGLSEERYWDPRTVGNFFIAEEVLHCMNSDN